MPKPKPAPEIPAPPFALVTVMQRRTPVTRKFEVDSDCPDLFILELPEEFAASLSAGGPADPGPRFVPVCRACGWNDHPYWEKADAEPALVTHGCPADNPEALQ